MNTQLSSESQSYFVITVEVVPEDPLDADLALVDTVGRDTADALRLDGYTIARHLLKAHKRRIRIDSTQQVPIKLTTEIDGTTIAIEALDLETAEATLKLSQRFQVEHPTVLPKATSGSKIKVTSSVPRNRSRKKR